MNLQDALVLPQKEAPFRGMVLMWGWLCFKCGYWWKPKDYDKPPDRCPSCNLENWDQPKQGEEAAEPMTTPKAVRR